MGWMDDLETCGVREPLPQVPYLGVPTDRNDRSSSRSPSRSRTLRHPPATASVSRRPHSKLERPRPSHSSVHSETLRAGGEERRGRNTVRQTQTAPSAPVFVLTDTGNTMTSHSTYHHDIKDHDTRLHKMRLNEPDVVVVPAPPVLSAAPPSPQYKTPSRTHPQDRRHHYEGSDGYHPHHRYLTHSRSYRQLKPTNANTSFYDHPSRSHCHVSAQLDPSLIYQETNTEHGRWAGGFHYHLQLPAHVDQPTREGWSTQGAYHQPPQTYYWSPSASFIGGFVVSSALSSGFVL